MATYVLIHGAYQGGWIWKPVATRLRAAGHTVYAPTLDGCGERKHTVRAGITVTTHAQEVAQFLHYEDLKDVILAGTSSGGMVIVKAAELARERIARLVLRGRAGPDAGGARGRPSSSVPRPTRSPEIHHRHHSRRRPRTASSRESRSGASRVGARPGHAAPVGRAGSADGSHHVLEPDVAGHRGDPLPPSRQSPRTPPAAHRRAPQGRLPRARHRPLSDAERARGADAAAARLRVWQVTDCTRGAPRLRRGAQRGGCGGPFRGPPLTGRSPSTRG